MIGKFFAKIFGESAKEYPPENEAGGCDINLMFKNINEENYKGKGSVFYTPFMSSGNDGWLGGLQGMDKLSSVFSGAQIDSEDQKAALADYLAQVGEKTEIDALSDLAELAGMTQDELAQVA